MVEVLLESNANIDDPGGRDCNGITPLIDAANNGHVSVVKLLIERGADVLIKDQRVSEWEARIVIIILMKGGNLLFVSQLV